ncbi:MAG: DUF1517 domain-containing protein [Spirulina sp. SIO3F2]|nr:DUF1517 domain-containing protein [Spirulina sp. SIO3F2]
MQVVGRWGKTLIRWGIVISLVGVLTLSLPHAAWAARTGGRMGGGSFNMPRRSYSAPQRSYRSAPTYPARPMYGGGWGFPFLIPFFGFGGGFGGIFSLLIGLALLNFIVNAFRNSGLGSSTTEAESTPQITVAQVQVGLLSGARSLQAELDALAQTVDTDSAIGRGRLLQETSLALLRHPEYWQYGLAQAKVAPLEQAEAQFNQYSLSERSKFTSETLANLNGDRQGQAATSTGNSDQDVGEYLVVTILVGTQDSLKLPKITSSETLRQAVQTLGALSSDRLLAIEVLWTPQAAGDTLTADDLLAQYPNLRLL